MSSSQTLTVNDHKYTTSKRGQYISSRLVTHNGITIAIALGRAQNNKQLFFDYSVLNGEEQEAAVKGQSDEAIGKASTSAEKLDSQTWLENAYSLSFPSELRVVGEEAVPVYQVPRSDSMGVSITAEQSDGFDPWLSTTLSIMDSSVTNFEVLSDGRYVYIFRQGLAATASSPNKFLKKPGTSSPSLNSNLLCDRFTLIGTRLCQTVEVRYQRSRQKCVPLNEKDTLSIRDINDEPFYEPTYLLGFVKDLKDGVFSILRVPTMSNDIFRWMIFAYSSRSGQVDCFTTDVAKNGLFDVRGQIYYTCKSVDHAETFSNTPGSCTAIRSDTGEICRDLKTSIEVKAALSERSLNLDGITADVRLFVERPIDLSASPFHDGFTLEGWICPWAFWRDDNEGTENNAKSDGLERTLPLQGSFFCIFNLNQDSQPENERLSVYLDDKLRLVLRCPGNSSILLKSNCSIIPEVWTHVAVTYSGGNGRSFELIIDGVASSSQPFFLHTGASPGGLSSLASGVEGLISHFRGQLDEFRIWSYPLHPKTIKSNMSTRATGMEPFLEACWHFDEGTGLSAFDATSNGRNLKIMVTSESQSSAIWQPSSAGIVGNSGLVRKTIRLAENNKIEGGINAGMYFEQVSISPETSSLKKDDIESEISVQKIDTKPIKRSARILLCFVTASTNRPNINRLAALDFGLLSDGMLCDFPAEITLPELSSFSDLPRTGLESRITTTSLIHIDAQGVEVFGGILPAESAQCARDCPVVWDSAIGAVIIYFRSNEGIFSAIKYDTSRPMIASSPSTLSGHQGILAVSKLRHAKSLTITTSKCTWAAPQTAVDVTINAQLANDSIISEIWRGLPSNLERFCDLINGISKPDLGMIGSFKKFLKVESEQKEDSEPSIYKLVLKSPLKICVYSASCLVVGNRHVQVVRDAKPGNNDILVSKAYFSDKSGETPSEGSTVTNIGYEHKKLVKCVGKPVGDFSTGSSLIGLTYSDSTSNTSRQQSRSELQRALVNASSESSVSVRGQSPAFYTPARSTALKIEKESVYSMLEQVTTTSPSSGLTFESWLKVEDVTESVIIAYNSERLARTESQKKEQQTFVLGIPGSSTTGNKHYELNGNANGSLFRVNGCDLLLPNEWVHVACSVRNAYALRFSGANYVDLGTASQWNVTDFSLAFSLQLDQVGHTDQVLFSKADKSSNITPLQLQILKSGQLAMSFWAESQDEAEDDSTARMFTIRSPLATPLKIDTPYKVFVSRKLLTVKREQAGPQLIQVVTMRVWLGNGSTCLDMMPPTLSQLEEFQRSKTISEYLNNDNPAKACGVVRGNEEAPLFFGGVPWSNDHGLRGSIGHIRLYSAAIPTPKSVDVLSALNLSDRSLIGVWSFTTADGNAVIDDKGSHNGKLKKGPAWLLSPFKPDHQLKVYINGEQISANFLSENTMLRPPAGPHQLTIGNTIHGSNDLRFLGAPNSFKGQLDELRIWNIPRTRENICDCWNSRLVEVVEDMAVYLPFDVLVKQASSNTTSSTGADILADASMNCWHLTTLRGIQPQAVISTAPISHDAPCVDYAPTTSNTLMSSRKGAPITSRPSVSEYGDIQVNSKGDIEGSYKRAYSYIDEQGHWILTTGFRVGSLITEWIGQVQTSPTLIGYVEGAPPIPVETFASRDDRPSSAIRFSQADRCIYSYSSRFEAGVDMSLAQNVAGGAKWQASAGVGFQTQITAGEVKAGLKTMVDISTSLLNNRMSSMSTTVDMDVRMELTGAWTNPESSGPEIFQPANTGLALVESEVADVFALRLKLRGSVSPLVAYQVRPNNDIPRDKNLVSFKINKAYTKQGCLDGRKGLKADDDYRSNQAPKEASYYKPIEAYALRDQINRAQMQLAGEWERFDEGSFNPLKKFPERASRNICNEYVWTADGGTYQAARSHMESMQVEIGANKNLKTSISASFDAELSFGTALGVLNLDAMIGAHANLTIQKENTTDSTFQLQAELPPSVNIHKQDSSGKLVMQPGAVDSYRWMSFWLEASTEATDAFFKQVVDPEWLLSDEANARLLLGLRDQLSQQPGNASTKAWRVLHRVTYVSRVPEPISSNLHAEIATAPSQQGQESGRTALMENISCNWRLLQTLEPLVRAAKTRAELVQLAQPHISQLYPSLRAQSRIYAQLLDLLADYVGLE